MLDKLIKTVEYFDLEDNFDQHSFNNAAIHGLVYILQSLGFSFGEQYKFIIVDKGNTKVLMSIELMNNIIVENRTNEEILFSSYEESLLAFINKLLLRKNKTKYIPAISYLLYLNNNEVNHEELYHKVMSDKQYEKYLEYMKKINAWKGVGNE